MKDAYITGGGTGIKPSTSGGYLAGGGTTWTSATAYEKAGERGIRPELVPQIGAIEREKLAAGRLPPNRTRSLFDEGIPGVEFVEKPSIVDQGIFYGSALAVGAAVGIGIAELIFRRKRKGSPAPPPSFEYR